MKILKQNLFHKRSGREKWFWLFGLIMIFFGSGQLLSGCLSFRMSEKEARIEFKSVDWQPVFEKYKIGERTIHYVRNGPDSLPLVIFVHGSPGSWNAFSDFLKDSLLLKEVQMIAVDRPGFGYSDYGKGEPSLDTQALLLKPILEKHKKNRKLILAGHSLGGPVIAKMAMLYPELIDHLIVVAGSVDPALEPKGWYRKPMAAADWALPGSISASNAEILALKKELEKMIPQWEKIRLPVTVIQGLQDDLVPPGNAAFLEKMLINAKIEVIRDPGMNHFIPWKKPALIRTAILNAKK